MEKALSAVYDLKAFWYLGEAGEENGIKDAR
jgi:hypothetical protein